MSDTGTIAKNPQLPTAQDYLQLRQLAIAFLQQSGSASWTDYNLHDPGITFTELLSYGITDLAYRQDMPMPNLLAVDSEGNINGESQTLYTPAEILTIGALTINDYRRLLIDITGVQNAWLNVCTTVDGTCGCQLYIDCDNGGLSYNQPKDGQALIYGGLYDVSLLLQNSPNGLGNLNSGSVTCSFNLPYSASQTPPWASEMCGTEMQDSYNGYLEMRFPVSPGQAITNPAYANLIIPGTIVTGIAGGVSGVVITSNTYETSTIGQTELQNYIGSTLYASVTIFYTTGNSVTGTFALQYIPFKVYFDNAMGSTVLQVSDLQSIIAETTAASIFPTYLSRLQQVETVIETAQYALNESRNYCEDFCTITLTTPRDYGICCTINTAPGTNLDQMQAAVYAGIINYLNSPLTFYSWQELVAMGYSIDQIFNGPRSTKGFLKPGDLENSSLRATIYTADIIKIIYQIPGIVGVTNFSIAQFDANGNISDTQPWQMTVTPGMIPNFYVFGSNIQFYENSLPFDTDLSDILNILSLLEVANQSPALTAGQLDVPLLTGQLMDLANYYPMMYSLPEVYNVSPSGPLPPFTPQRYAQANQLQAYLLLYEQFYADWLAQIGNLKLFFNIINPALHTYVSKFICNTDLPGVDNLYTPCYNAANLQSNCESTLEYNDRKNRIYNHLMARFGEDSGDYVMISNTLNNFMQNPPAEVLSEKARLLRKYPDESYNKARALDYRYHTQFTSSIVQEGLIDKLCDLMGLDSVSDFFHWQAAPVNSPGNYQLVGNSINTTLSFSFNIYINVVDNQEPPAVMSEGYYDQAVRAIDTLLDPAEGGGPRYWEDGYYIMAVAPAPGNNLTEICRLTTAYNSLADAAVAYAGLVAALNQYWIGNMILPIEHILLRPYQVGEATLSTCVPANCSFCGDEDPYSFRMTIIMCGEQGYPGFDLNFRAYAETLINTQLPAHLLCKVCWVSEADCIALSCYYRNYIRLTSCRDNYYNNEGNQSGSGSGLTLPAYDIYTSSGLLSGSGSGTGPAFNGWIGGYQGCWTFEGTGSGNDTFGTAGGCLETGCGDAACIAAARTILVNKLNSISSLYPAALLNTCADGSPAGLVYLGKTNI